MVSDRFGNPVDPEADRCPWCGEVRRWKGRHAAAVHPEKWEAFKTVFTEEKTTTTRWVRRDDS